MGGAIACLDEVRVIGANCGSGVLIDTRSAQASQRHSDSYLLLDVGWGATGRVHSVAFHLRIKNDKIWIEWDGTTPGIAQELIDAGIPQEDIVLGFHRPPRCRFRSGRDRREEWKEL